MACRSCHHQGLKPHSFHGSARLKPCPDTNQIITSCSRKCRNSRARPGGRSHVAASMFQRYYWPAGLVAGLAATGFGLGAQKSGSAVMYSFGALLIFALTANSVLSVLIWMSAVNLFIRARLSGPKASVMPMAPGFGSIALSESIRSEERRVGKECR